MDESINLQAEKRRLFLLQILASYGPLFGIATVVGLIVIYWITHEWQLLGSAGISLVSTFLFILADKYLKWGNSWLAAFIMTLAAAALFSGISLFWSGVTLILIIGSWTIPLAFIYYGMKPDFQRLISVLTCLIATGIIIYLELVPPISRLDVTEPHIIRWLLPLLVILVGFLVLKLILRNIYPLGLSNRLLISILTIIFMTMITFFVSSIFNIQAADRQSTINSLVLIATIAIVISIIGAIILVRSITAPLERLVSVTKKFAGGHLQSRAEIEQDDEIGQVALSFNNMADQLQGFVQNLEKRVAERTYEVDRRAAELQVVAEIAREASISKNLNDLLARSSHLIHERLGFYHTSIYILDDKREYAVIQAADGEAGKLLLASKFKLRVGDIGLIGYVTQTGKSRIAVDTGEDKMYFRNQLLPYTRSEMTLPLKVKDEVLGALDIQSDKMNAFNENDISILQILADQLAISVERIQLMIEVEESTKSLERSYQEHAIQTWQSFLGASGTWMGYEYDGISPQPLATVPDESQKVLSTGQAFSNAQEVNSTGGILAVPVKIRGQVIGVLRLKFEGRQLTSENQMLVQEAADRLALALENTRLLSEAQRRAQREQKIANAVSRIRETMELESVLRSAAQEFKQAFNLAEAEVRITSPETTNLDDANR